MAEARAEARAEAKKNIGIFVNSAPLACPWPRETVLIANGKIYPNEPGDRHAEIVFLGDFKKTGSVEEEVNMYLNYSPCDECCTALVDFLTENSGVTFHIKFAHVYYSSSSNRTQIRDELRRLNAHDQITLKAVRGEDWEKIMRPILRDQGLEEWAPSETEWSMTKESILEQQVDWEEELVTDFNKFLKGLACGMHKLKDIMTNDHKDWGTHLGRYRMGANGMEFHNKAMQVLYNHGEGSLQRIVDTANGEGYAFLLHVLGASGIEGDLLELLRKRIVADFVADKEFRYIIEHIDGEADAAVGNEAADAAE